MTTKYQVVRVGQSGREKILSTYLSRAEAEREVRMLQPAPRLGGVRERGVFRLFVREVSSPY